MEFNRFNEELVYPKADSKIGGDAKSQLRRYDLDRLSAVSRKSKTSLSQALSRKSMLQSRISSNKYLKKDAFSIKSMKSIKSKRAAKPPLQPDDALKLISMERLRRTLVKVNNGTYSPVKNVDEELLANENIRLDAEED